jgi:hypothetical protein
MGETLAGQPRDREALAHSELAELAFTTENKAPGTHNNATKTTRCCSTCAHERPLSRALEIFSPNLTHFAEL